MSIKIERRFISNIDRFAFYLTFTWAIILYEPEAPTFYVRHIETEQCYLNIIAF